MAGRVLRRHVQREHQGAGLTQARESRLHLGRAARLPFLIGVAAALMALLALGCQPSQPQQAAPAAPQAKPPAAPTVQPAAQPAAAPKATTAPAAQPAAPAAQVPKGGTIVLALNGDPDTINPSLNWGPTGAVGAKIVDGLISSSPDLSEVKPELAASWEISPDGRTYTFHLQKGVLWHDGKPFTSEDVKWSFENVNRYHPIGQRWFPLLESIQTPDPLTVVMKLKQGFGPLLASLSAHNGGAISPKHMVEAGADPRKHEKLNRAPIGTGPFVFKEWRPGDRIVLARNDKYWKPGLPHLDQLIFKIIPDQSSMILALRAGDLNWIDYIFTGREDVVRLEKDPKYQILARTSVPMFDAMPLNFRRPPLDKPEVRKALYVGLDRSFLLDKVYQGLETLPLNMIDHRLSVAADPSVDLQKMYPYDVAKANKMLDDAGVPRKADGTRFKLTLMYEAARSQWKEVGEVLRASWDKIGVKVDPEPVERAVFVDRAFSPKRDYDMTLIGYTSMGDPSLGVSRAFVCEDDAKPTSFGNPTGYCRKDVDDMFKQAAEIPDFGKRQELFRKIQKILAEDMPQIIIMGTQGRGIADREFNYSSTMTTYGGYTGWESVHKVR